MFFLVILLGWVGEASSLTVQRLAALPIDSSPGSNVFQAADGFLYGVILEHTLPNPTGKSGGVYRLSPQGDFSFIHQFDSIEYWPLANDNGACPTDTFAMGKDGFFYGLAFNGGLYGYGVFYRLSVDGVYQVISHFDHLVIPYNYGITFIEGPDDAFYIITDGWDEHRLMRLGFDGTQSIVGDHLPANLVAVRSVSQDKNRLAMVSIEGATGTVKVRYVELPSGNTLEEKSYPVFPSNVFSPGVISIDEQTLRLYCHCTNIDQLAPGEIVDLDLASGNTTLVTQYSFQSVCGTWPTPFPWDWQSMQLWMPGSIRFDKDGGIYFGFGMNDKGPFGSSAGTKLYYLPPGGSSSLICDFDGFPLLAMAFGNDGSLYGLSWGNAIVPQDAPPSDPVDAPAAQLAQLAQGPQEKTAPHQSVLSMNALARSAKPVMKSRHGTFRVAKNDTNLPPVVKVDRVTLPRNKTLPGPILVPVLKNDKDPEHEALSLQSVSAASSGTASITMNSKGAQLISYTPSVFPCKSENLAYTVADPHGLTSTAHLLIRGDVSGTYLAPAGTTAPLLLKVTSQGKFSALVKAGTSGSVSFTGTLDFSDKATLQKRLKDGTIATLKIEIGATADQQRVVNYEYTCGDLDISGNLPRK